MAEEAATAESEASESASTESETTFTQAQVNDLIAKEKGKIQSRFGDYADIKAKAAKLEEIENANASELEKAQKKAAEAERIANESTAKLLRFEVANDLEVPAKLVPLLTATDREGLEAQANLILENAKTATPNFDGGAREPAEEELSPEEAHNKLFLKAVGLID